MFWYMRSSTTSTTSRAGALSTGPDLHRGRVQGNDGIEIHPTNGTEPVLVRKREPGVRYDAASHAPTQSLILTSNIGGLRNRALFTAPVSAPADWTPLMDSEGAAVLPHDEGRSLDNPRAFKDFVVVTGREDGFTQIWVAPLTASGDQECSAPVAAQAHRMTFEADAFTARLGANAEFDPQQQLRVTYSSTVAPGSTMQYDVTSKTYEVLKVAPVPNYDATLYDTERLEVPARDGVKIPVTLFWRKDQKKPNMPTHLYGYGSYGISMDPSFSASRLALVDRPHLLCDRPYQRRRRDGPPTSGTRKQGKSTQVTTSGTRNRANTSRRRTRFMILSTVRDTSRSKVSVATCPARGGAPVDC